MMWFTTLGIRMTSDDRAFLAAIIAAPDDDLPRLIYADALDERGDPRGEFIRVQCELAKLRDLGCHEGETCNITGPCSECNRDVEAEPLRRRERELLEAHGRKWLPFPDGYFAIFGTADDHATRFRRGFVEFVRISGDDFARHRKALMAAAPITRVELTSWPNHGGVRIQRHYDALDMGVYLTNTWHIVATGELLTNRRFVSDVATANARNIDMEAMYREQMSFERTVTASWRDDYPKTEFVPPRQIMPSSGIRHDADELRRELSRLARLERTPERLFLTREQAELLRRDLQRYDPTQHAPAAFNRMYGIPVTIID